MNNRQNNTILHVIILISDMLGSSISLLGSYLIRYGVAFGIEKIFDQLWVLGVTLFATIVISIIISPINRFTIRGCFAELMDVLKRQFFTILLMICVMYLAHSASELSRLVVLYYAILSLIIMWTLRLGAKWYINNSKSVQEASSKILVVSYPEKVQEIANNISKYRDFDRTVCNVVAIQNGDYNAALEFATRNEVDEVFVSLSRENDDTDYQRFITDLLNMRLKVDIDLDQFEMDIPGNKNVDRVGQYAVLTAAINVPSIGRRALKRLIDIVGSMFGLILCLIAFIIIGPLIKLDSKGPIIFSQNRVGKNGRLFRFYKFRSMCVDAESQKESLMKKNEVEGLMFKIEDDPRITRIGKFIRKTSIDELPQFWNVLIGDMSLVGTRPPTVDEYQKYESWQKARLSMKPGITGLWQVSGRSDIKNFDEVVKLDVEYIDNWSFSLDLKIMLKTIGVVFTEKGSR